MPGQKGVTWPVRRKTVRRLLSGQEGAQLFRGLSARRVPSGREGIEWSGGRKVFRMMWCDRQIPEIEERKEMAERASRIQKTIELRSHEDAQWSAKDYQSSDYW